jgi:hypothetical protein
LSNQITCMKRFLIIILSIIFISCNQQSPEEAVLNSLPSNSMHKTSYKKNYIQKDYEKLGFDLMQKETIGKLKIGLSIHDLIKILGNPTNKTENELLPSDGEYHQTYNYLKLGIKLDLIGKNENYKTINTIRIEHPCKFKTQKGIAIGSNTTEIINAYKEGINPAFSDSSSIVVGSYFGGMIFRLHSGCVTSIYLGINAQ